MSSNYTPWERVQISRSAERPTSLDYISTIFERYMSLHGDRYFGDDKAIVGGLASIGGRPVTVIGQQKGRSTKENIKRNFGMPSPEGYRKSLRLMKQAEKFHRPIILFVDTPGAFCGLEAEEGGVGEAIARNLFEMSNLQVPILSVVIGEGGSGGALAMATSDEVWLLENSIYSILSPEGFASILWKDSTREREACDIMKITAEDLTRLGVCDHIISEADGGAHNDPQLTAENISDYIEGALKRKLQKGLDELLEGRYNKFRTVGEFEESSQE